MAKSPSNNPLAVGDNVRVRLGGDERPMQGVLMKLPTDKSPYWEISGADTDQAERAVSLTIALSGTVEVRRRDE